MKKKFFLILITSLLIFNSTTALNIKDSLINSTNSEKVNVDNSSDGLNTLASLLAWFKEEIMVMVWVLAVGVFIFIGFKIVMARGNPEEFKKAMMYFVYSVLGILLIFIAWGLVKLVSSIRL